MFRTTAARYLPRSLSSINAAPSRSALAYKTLRAPLTSLARPLKASQALSLALRKPLATALVRYQTTASINKDEEKALQSAKINPDPKSVSAESSIHNVTYEEGVEAPEHDVDMMAGIRSDFV